jgi:hypothetical protein
VEAYLIFGPSITPVLDVERVIIGATCHSFKLLGYLEKNNDQNDKPTSFVTSPKSKKIVQISIIC